jgi:membrane-bound ClpP family serine protease
VKSIDELDVLIHTTGVTIDGSFTVARAIREVANKVNYMIPYMAWSGGTSIAISGDSILMGACAQLSAINPKSDGRLATYPIAIIAYIRNVMSHYIESFEDEDKAVAAIDQLLIQHLMKGDTAQEIAELWALRRKSRYYDKQMLTYTKPHPNQEDEIEELLNILACDDLDHGTIFDYDVLKGLLLPVEKMNFELSDLTQELIDKLREKGDNFEICDRVCEDKRAPYIKYHPAPIEEDVKIDGQNQS